MPKSKCEVINKLELAHRLVHEFSDDMSDAELDLLEELTERLLNVINNEEAGDKYPNSVKLVAIFDVLGIGIDVLQGLALHKDWANNNTVTIH